MMPRAEHKATCGGTSCPSQWAGGRELSAWTPRPPGAWYGGPHCRPRRGIGRTRGGPVGVGGNTWEPAGAPLGSSATGAAGGREPLALALPRWAAPGGSGVADGGGAAPGPG